MSVFETELRASVDDAVRGLQEAYQSDTRSNARRYAARIMDLLDRARAYDINTAGWVSDPVLDMVRATEDAPRS